MTEKVVQVILNTNNYISGSTNNDANFSIDWNAILKPNKPYKMHFTYIGGNNVYTGAKPALVSINFNFDVYEAKSSINALNSNVIGFLKPVVIQGSSNTCFLQAETNTNEPVYLQSKPSNNTFNVRIVDTSGGLWLDNATTPAVPANWVLTLHFIEC